MQAEASKIVILCYFHLFSIINFCKIIQNIKNCLLMPAPPSGGGLWCDTPVSNRWRDWTEDNKYRGSLLRYQPVCL